MGDCRQKNSRKLFERRVSHVHVLVLALVLVLVLVDEVSSYAAQTGPGGGGSDKAASAATMLQAYSPGSSIGGPRVARSTGEEALKRADPGYQYGKEGTGRKTAADSFVF